MSLLGRLWHWFQRDQEVCHPRGRPYSTREEGLYVRSFGEQRIANWLSRRGIPFTYEPNVDGMRPDFQIDGTKILIEYWGGAAYRGYEKRMVHKVHRYEEADYTLISLFPAHMHELEKVLEAELQRYGIIEAT